MIKLKTAILQPVIALRFKKCVYHVKNYEYNKIPLFMWADERFVTKAAQEDKYLAESIYEFLPKRSQRKAFIIPVLKVNPSAINVTHKLRKDKDVIYAYAEGKAGKLYIDHLKKGTSEEDYKEDKRYLIDGISEMLSHIPEKQQDEENRFMYKNMMRVFAIAEDPKIAAEIAQKKEEFRKMREKHNLHKQELEVDKQKLYDEIERQ